MVLIWCLKFGAFNFYSYLCSRQYKLVAYEKGNSANQRKKDG